MINIASFIFTLLLITIIYISLFVFPQIAIISISVYLTLLFINVFAIVLRNIYFTEESTYRYIKRFNKPGTYIGLLELISVLTMFIISNNIIAFYILLGFMIIVEVSCILSYIITISKKVK